MTHHKIRNAAGIRRTGWLPVAVMLGLGVLAGCGTGNIAASGDRPAAAASSAATVSPGKGGEMAPLPGPSPTEQPLKGALSDTARDRNVRGSQALPHTSGHRSSAHQQPNYEYHKDDVLSAPPEARNRPRWDERLQPEYQRRLSRIDDTVYDIRQRSRLEQLRREKAQRKADKASRIARPAEDFSSDRRGSSRYRY